MKIAFIAPPITGHLNPMTTLAREFQARNHNVVFISLPDGEAVVKAAGLTFLPCAANEFPAGSLNQRFRERSKLQGEEALRVILRNAAARTEGLLNSLPATLTAASVDAVVLDTVLFYTELAPVSLGMPYAHVANALHFDYSGHTPPCFYDWPHETTPAALARNRKGIESFLEMLAPTKADRTTPEQHHSRQARSAIGTAEAFLCLHHPCRAEHCVGSTRSRRSSSCYSNYR